LNTFQELKRRNVFRVGAAYLVMGWLLIEVASVLLPTFGAPEWVMKVFALLIILGFPIALFFAWAFELTPEGVKREADVDRSQSITPQTGRKLDFTVIGLLLIALAYFVWERQQVPAEPETGGAVVAEVAFEGHKAASASVPGRATAEGAVDQRISIAVLPFVNMSDDADNEYFSDGIAEELLNTLVKLKQLRVASRTSSFFFKGKEAPIGQIAEELGVAHILEGSVRKAGNQVRITAQLIDVATDSHLWSETYDRELEDIFAIQSEISESIAAALQVALGTGTASAQTTDRPTESLAAYDAYLQGRHFMAMRGAANLQRAISEFSRATQLDPSFADAHGSLAKALALYPGYSRKVDGREYAIRADQAIERALELVPNQRQALIAKAYAAFNGNLDWASASRLLEGLLREYPGDSEVHNFAGDFYRLTGDYKHAESEERKALELDPLAEVHARDLSFLMISMGRFDEAVKYAQRAYQLLPERLEALLVLAHAQALNGNTQRALQVLSMIENHAGSDPVMNLWAQLQFYSDTHDIEQLKARTGQLVAYMEQGEIPAAFGAYKLLEAGQIDQSLEWLDRAYDNNDDWLADDYQMYLPELYSTDPRWLEFWQRPGLAELIQLRRDAIRQGNGRDE
jgi:TolB-like protein/cytochrome c-type biogenesis protein CcmH/NrfG